MDRTNVSLLVNMMSTETANRSRPRLKADTFSLPPDFPRPHLVPPKAEEKVAKYLEACLAVVKADFHESLMVLKALSALRDESKGFAEQYHLAEGRSILAESAIWLSLRDILPGSCGWVLSVFRSRPLPLTGSITEFAVR